MTESAPFQNPEPKDLIEFGGRAYRIVSDKQLAPIDELGRNPDEWMRTEGADLLTQAAVHLDGLVDLGVITVQEYGRLQNQVAEGVRRKRQQVFGDNYYTELDTYARTFTNTQEENLFSAAREANAQTEEALQELYDQLEDRWIIETVRLFYPDQATEIEQQYPADACWGKDEFWEAYCKLYDQAHDDFGVLQARGREMALLSLFIEWGSPQVFESKTLDEAQARLDDIKVLIRQRVPGISNATIDSIINSARSAVSGDNWQNGVEDLRQ